MKVIWSKIKKTDFAYKLILEGSIIPKEIYKYLKSNKNYEGMVITSFDLESNNFELLMNHFNDRKIAFKKQSFGLWIDSTQIEQVFSNTDFGNGMDSFYLLEKIPHDIRDNYLNDVLSSSFLKTEGIFINNESMPDLEITFSNKELLLGIKEYFNQNCN